MSCNRFSDEKYKNWLKTTMSLLLLRGSLDDFVRNESGTFHRSLGHKLGSWECQAKCTVPKTWKPKANQKVPPVCENCKLWQDEILQNHSNRGGQIYWDNSKPHLWSSNKWEVAKVYMPRGNSNHSKLEEFDISAVLNFMKFCKHFKNIVKESAVNSVTNVRNTMMHSPDMKVDKEDMDKHLEKIQNFAKTLQEHVPEMKNLQEKIEELQNMELNINSKYINQNIDESQSEVLKNLLNAHEGLSLEQKVLKEKIEFLSQCFNEGKEKDKYVEDLLSMRKFLDQNKDLLDQLGPQVEKLKEIKERVDKHDHQLTDLSEKVDTLERSITEPVSSIDAPRYKNHLLELVRKNKWADPIFTETCEFQGYTGQVVVNGRTFRSKQVHRNKIAAHQDVSKIALGELVMQSSDNKDSINPSEYSTSAANPIHFTAVKVPVKKTLEGSEAATKEDALLQVYSTLAKGLTLGDGPSGSAKQMVLDFFSQAEAKPPVEECEPLDNGTFKFKLVIDGEFTFTNKEGTPKKQQAEQQAAEEALSGLAMLLDWDHNDANRNFKGALQELVMKQGSSVPSYKQISPLSAPVRGATLEDNSITDVGAGAGSSAKPCDEYSHMSSSSGSLKRRPPEAQSPQTSKRLQTKISDQKQSEPSTSTDNPGSSTKFKDCSLSSSSPIYFAAVKVPVKMTVEGPVTGTKVDALQQSYKTLIDAFVLRDKPSESARQMVLDFFSHAEAKLPMEECETLVDGTFKYRLTFDSEFTFRNREGESKKQKAEQDAAKEALQQLAGLLQWDHTDVNGNFKGILQELLAKQNRGKPTYARAEGPPHPSQCQTTTAESSLLAPSPNQTSGIEYSENPRILDCLKIFGFLPIMVQLKHFQAEHRITVKSEIHLVNYIFKNKVGHTSKKNAIHKTFFELGKILGIFTNIEENKSTGLVKEHFTRNSFSVREVVQTEDTKFFCSLEITCHFSFEGQGSSDEEARQDASKQAFSGIAALFGCESSMGRNDQAEERLSLMLETAGQKKATFSQTGTQHKASATLSFNNITLNRDEVKKTAQNKVYASILGFLGEDILQTSVSVRNQADDWFKRKQIPPPVFESTEKGVRATFSAPLTISNTDWECSQEDAENKLIDELQARLRCLSSSEKK